MQSIIQSMPQSQVIHSKQIDKTIPVLHPKQRTDWWLIITSQQEKHMQWIKETASIMISRQSLQQKPTSVRKVVN